MEAEHMEATLLWRIVRAQQFAYLRSCISNHQMPTIKVLCFFIFLLSSIYSVQQSSAKTLRSCKFDLNSFNESFQNATVVVTATVKRVIIDSANRNLQTAEVWVRRVIKGRNIVRRANEIIIYGVGNAKVCRSFLFERDTKVILLSVKNEQYFLNPPIVPITLEVLDFIDSLMRAHCERIQCPYGSKCVITSGECICRTACHHKGPVVCGTDNVSYPSECHLSVRSCKNTKLGKPEIRIKHYSKCRQHDPCTDLQCGPGEECVVSDINGVLSGRCECPERCDDYGTSVESSPVCASDGKEYKSLCHLRLYSCQKQQNITAKYRGKCDPCKDFKCSLGTVCKLNADRQPECRCSEQCSLERNPVCASDGNTYENECLMSVFACRSDITLRVISKGHCMNDNPCASKQCGIGQSCHVVLNGTAVCRCRDACPSVVSPVCGLDGKTYDNDCELMRIACEKRVENEVKHVGPCGMGACANFMVCEPPKVCVLRENRPHCECEQCGSHLDQVCASNGVTYSNPCKMRLEACQTGQEIFRRYRGVCEGCANVKCEFYSFCVADQRGVGKCQCPKTCLTEGNEIVCATDGITYETECHMRIAACKQQKFIVVSFKGSCDSCSNVVCPYGQKCEDGLCSCPSNCPEVPAYQLVCGDDGVLYRSECHLQSASCLRGAPIKILPYEECKSIQMTSGYFACNAETCSYGGFCVDIRGNGVEECICDFSCTSEPGKEICASDGVVYNSTCHMDSISCKLQKPIYVYAPLISCAFGGDCGCNRVGAFDNNCDEVGQCRCKPGVGGLKCDHCVPSFWGLHLIARGTIGCQPCGCSAFGSSRLDCEQSTGRCQCKNGASGEKCDTCDLDYILTPGGCVAKEEFKAPRDCSSTQCVHGAKCVISATDMPDCICPTHCSVDYLGMVANLTICGNDGITYDNMCDLMEFACTHQLDLVPVSLGICTAAQDSENIPMRRERKKERVFRFGIGSSCNSDLECKVPESFCFKPDDDYKGRCSCKTGFQFSNSSKQCIQAIDVAMGSEACDKLGECCTAANCDDKKASSKERSVPFFDGNGLLILESLRLDARKFLEVEIWLKVSAPDGLVFYWPKLSEDGVYKHGDFVALAIIAYQPHFFWNLGSGVSYVKAPLVLSNHRFYSVHFKRHLRNGTIQIDSGFVARQISLPKNEHLDVYGSDVYIGGVPDPGLLPPFIPELNTRFQGAIQQFSINGIIYGDIFTDLRHVGDIHVYEGAPCIKGICNSGICFAKLNEFSCHCPSNSSGLHCEKGALDIENDLGAYFTGDSEYAYFNRITHGMKGQRSVKFSFWFKTTATDGLLWWENQGASLQNDYLGIFLRNGRLGVIMNLGNDPKMRPIYMHSRLNNNVWHKVSFSRLVFHFLSVFSISLFVSNYLIYVLNFREKRRVELRVDAESTRYFASEGSTELNSDGIVWIGGKKQLPLKLPVISLFKGCVKRVLIDGEELSLRRDVLAADVPDSCPN